jgi:hypothetical protein
LKEVDANGGVVTVPYVRAWEIMDNCLANNYLSLQTNNNSCQNKLFGMVGIMRKDVECALGILKDRFRILKTGIRVHGIEATDKIWRTCCALHTIILIVDDGINVQWENGISSDWEGSLGEHNNLDVSNNAPFAVSRLLSLEQHRSYYNTRDMGRGNEYVEEHIDDNEVVASVEHLPGDTIICRHVNRLSVDYFRERLVEHFDIMFKNGEVQGPSRLNRE